MNFITEFVETLVDGNYLGPWTDLSSKQSPINSLDAQAMVHDYAYARANRTGGRTGRVQKAQADFALGRNTHNPIVKLGMYSQGMIRVFTFNQIELPW